MAVKAVVQAAVRVVLVALTVAVVLVALAMVGLVPPLLALAAAAVAGLLVLVVVSLLLGMEIGDLSFLLTQNMPRLWNGLTRLLPYFKAIWRFVKR